MRANASLVAPALRIAHVVNEPFSLDGANGVQQMVYCLARAQAEEGHAVAVFSRETGVHVLAGAHEGLRRVPFSLRRGTSLRDRLLTPYFERGLLEGVLTWQPDLVHFHSVHIPRNVALAAHVARARIPYCVTIHGGLFGTALRRALVKKTVFKVLFERHYLNEAAFIHALSPHEREVIRQYGVNRPVVVVPNGLPPDANVPASEKYSLFAANPRLRGRRVFMFIGRLDPWQKGLDLLLKAFAECRLPNAVLVLVGPDCRGSSRALGRLAGRLGISSQVVFVEPAFGPDRANLFAAADVFVHPSRWEGCSLSVLSAAAAGKPCLITREADPLGQLERVQAALLVDASTRSVAAGLRQAASLSHEALETMGRRGQAVAATQFTWPAIARRLAEAYGSARTPANGAEATQADPRWTAERR
jgi:glycosyltransferase involved in cell wall biosynthesis